MNFNDTSALLAFGDRSTRSRRRPSGHGYIP
jgi:hypothetical protein